MRFLVCVDLSPQTDLVIEAAAELARETEGALVVLHVATSEPVLTSGGALPSVGHRVPPEDLAERRARVAALAARLSEGGLSARGEVLLVDDDVASQVAAHAREIDASHVVIGSHGKTSLLDALIGTVTKGVLERAKVPVIVVPRRR